MPKWIRVRDTKSGHEFDVSPVTLRAANGGLEPVNKSNYPDLDGPSARPRPAKPRVGRVARRQDAAPGEQAARDERPADTD